MKERHVEPKAEITNFISITFALPFFTVSTHYSALQSKCDKKKTKILYLQGSKQITAQ